MNDQQSPDHSRQQTDANEFLSGGGDTGALMRSLDWSKTSLGPPEHWPQSLRSAVGICLGTNFPIAIYWGPDLALLYNDAWSDIPGEKHPWALGQPGRDVWPEIWDAIGPLFEVVQLTGEGVWQEDQLLPMHRHGYTEECYFNFTFSPIRGEDGSVEGIFNAVVETTFRVIAERRERTLRELAESVAGARSEQDVLTAAGRVLGSNPEDIPFWLVYSHPPEAETPQLVCSGGIEVPSVAWPLELLQDSKGPLLVEKLSSQLGAAIGGGIWPEPIDRALLAPFGGNGQGSMAAGFLVTGISPRRALDDDYEAFVARAAAHVGTAITNVRAFEEERRRAERLAEIDRAKTAFFSNVSHEFRTPLTLMLGPLEEALADPAVVPLQRERIEVIQRNGLRLLKLVNSLLDFARIEAGKTQANLEPVDLAKLTADLASNFRSAMEKAGLSYRVECEPLTRTAIVDRDMWEKIVLNLLSNAFKFTFEGEVAVNFRELDGAAVLTVRDTGTGIPAAEQPSLFERFHRVEGARGRSIEGSGIGLALVQELVRFHGGQVDVRSEEGKGSIFTVKIPLDRAGIAIPAAQGSAGSTAVRAEAYVEEALRWLPEGGPALSTNGVGKHLQPPADAPRILLADDNADMRDYVRRLLAGTYDVEIAEDGLAALDSIRNRRPDLLLTDIMMSRLDGVGLIKSIREDDKLSDLPIIALSARAGEEEKMGGLEVGADDYLVKPFSARELVATVRSNLELAKTRREAMVGLRRHAERLESLKKTAGLLAGELDLDQLVQTVTDSGVELTGAQFGAFFYNVADDKGESYMLYTLSGVPRSEFSKFPMPRNTKVFAPTFEGKGVVRSDDIMADERYGHNEPHKGMPKGHLPVRSYLAVPVTAADKSVVGGLFFGHAEIGRFTADHEALVEAIATQAAVAFENARLFKTAQQEIDQRKATERELETLNSQLQAMISDAVGRAKVAEQALLQSQKMEAIGQLTGGIAHDFNNLLQVVSGNLQLLGRDIADQPAAQRKVANALEGVARGSKLASQLLSFGRRQPLEPKVVNIGRFVAGMEEMLQRTLGEAIEVEIVRSGGLWNTLVDVVQVENAILNLAINARDAMEGRGKLTIEVGNAFLDDAYALQHDVEAGQYVMLALTDTGSGMPQDVMAKVFDPFFTTKPVGKGTGLGLSMVHGFVKQSGGHVKIYSEMGEGTTVKLYFPRSHLLEEAVIDTDHGPVVGGAETILVAEDDEKVRETVVAMLAELGYSVLKAKDATAALTIIESGVPIDLLFTDVVMPGPLRSADMARQARERIPELAVLFTSGYTENSIVHGGRLDVGVELLSKPYSREAMARKIRHVLNNARQTKAAMKPREVAGGERISATGSSFGTAVALTVPEGRRRVLLVEDNDLIRMSTVDMLVELGYEALEAGSAEEALGILEDCNVDIVVSDLGLPGMSGNDFCREVRRRWPAIGIVFATGRDAGPALDDTSRTALLPKPHGIEELARALEDVNNSSDPST